MEEDKPIKCLINITVPGYGEDTWKTFKKLPEIKLVTDQLDKLGISCQSVDNVAGWGCLNQDWIEFEAFVYTSWGWCKIDQFENWDKVFYPLLVSGKLLMYLSYIKETKEGKEYIPHH